MMRLWVWMCALSLLLWVAHAHAYTFRVSGLARGLPTSEVRLYCSAWHEYKTTTADAEGRYRFEVAHPHPAKFWLTHGSGDDIMRLDVFVFEDLEITANMVAENGVSNYFMYVPHPRSVAFKRAQGVVDQLYVGKSTLRSTLDPLVPMLRSTAEIGEDAYTDVFVRASKVLYLHTMEHDYRRRLDTTAFDTRDFALLPRDDVRFMGFDQYVAVMAGWHEREIQRLLAARAPQGQRPAYALRRAILDSLKQALPFRIYFELALNSYEQFRYDRLADDEKTPFLTELAEFVVEYPNNPRTEALADDLTRIYQSLENKPAPDFRLLSDKGDSVSLGRFAGRMVLLDVWGSWCRPCRVNNLKLVSLHEECRSAGIDVAFVSIAKDEFSDTWLDAIAADRMTWTQLLADDAFLRTYSIAQYPTAIVIDASGNVRRISSSITLADLLRYVAP